MPRKPKPVPAWHPTTDLMREFRLRDEQWEILQNLANLVPEARVELEKAIGFYKGLRQEFVNQPTAAATKKKVENIALTVRNLIQQLKEGGNDVDGMLVKQVPTQPGLQLLIGYKYIQHFLDELERFQSYSTQAYEDIIPSRPGPSREDIDILNSHLNRILKMYSHKHFKGLSRSINKDSPMEFVAAVFNIADPDVDKGSLDASVKQIVSKFRSSARNS
jgi:hypothetical protein